jgi:hypothetical protein
MQFKKHLLFPLIIGALLLGACNMPMEAPVTPTSTLPVEMIVQTRVAAIPTNTQFPTPIMPTATVTPLVFPPTPTLTLFYDSTVTATLSLVDCPLIITKTDTKEGDMLHILRCEDKMEYDIGPFAKGIYAIGPNQKFIVYVTDNGYVFVGSIGNRNMVRAANLVREKKFTAINRRVRPQFVISFWGEEPHYQLVLTEKRFDERGMYMLPVLLLE